MDSVSNEQKYPFSPSNFKAFKDISLSPIIENNKENSVMSKLKKLPNISLNCVKSESIFKVPESPKQITINSKYNTKIENETKVIFGKRGLSERLNVLDTIDLTKMHLSKKKIPNQKQVTNNNIASIKNNAVLLNNKAPQIKNNHDEIIPKKPRATSKTKTISKKENIKIKRTSTPFKILMKSPNISKIKSGKLKTVKLVGETSKTFLMSHEAKQIDNNAIINETEIQTKNLDDGNFTLMDLSSNGQINIVPASPNTDFNNINTLDYNRFAIEINKDFDYNMEKTSQSDMENGSSIRQGLTHSSSNIEYGIETLDNDQNSNSYFKDTLLQNNDTNYSMDACIIDKGEQFLYEMKNLFCDNVIEKTSQSEFQNDFKPIPEVTQQNENIIPNVMSDESINGIKRQNFQHQSTTNKKQKTDNEIE